MVKESRAVTTYYPNDIRPTYRLLTDQFDHGQLTTTQSTARNLSESRKQPFQSKQAVKSSFKAIFSGAKLEAAIPNIEYCCSNHPSIALIRGVKIQSFVG